MDRASARTALVIGATGGFGSHVTAALLKRGWAIRAMARDPAVAMAKCGPRMPIAWVRGDAMNRDDVIAAADGARLIVHAVNPPAYHDWSGLVRQMLSHTIAAARSSGARIVYPGSVYNFAPDCGPSIAEHAAQRPTTRKGALRVEMEAMLEHARGQGVRTLVVRAGDFFGPAAPASALGWLTVRHAGKVRAVFRPGPSSVGHAYAYLPDLGETVGRLIDREAELTDFEVFHFAGHWLVRGDEMGASIRRLTGQARLPILSFPWPLIGALAPFVELFRELIEMRYLWRRPIGLANAKLAAFLGGEPHTPLDTALAATLADMGCLKDAGWTPPAPIPYMPGHVRPHPL